MVSAAAGEVDRCVAVALGLGDGGPLLAFGRGLAGHHPLQVLGHVDVQQADGVDVRAPGAGAALDHLRNLSLNLVALAEQLVERHASDDVAKRRLGVLGDGVAVVLDGDDRLRGVLDHEEDDAIHLDRDVVAGDDLLMWDVEGEQAGVDKPNLVEHRKHQHHPGALQPVVFAETKDDAALPLGGDADDAAHPNGQYQGQDGAHGKADACAHQAS